MQWSCRNTVLCKQFWIWGATLTRRLLHQNHPRLPLLLPQFRKLRQLRVHQYHRLIWSESHWIEKGCYTSSQILALMSVCSAQDSIQFLAVGTFKPYHKPTKCQFWGFLGYVQSKTLSPSRLGRRIRHTPACTTPQTHQIVRTLGCPLGRFGAAIWEYLRSPSGNIWDVPLQRESFKGSVIRKFAHKNSLLLYSNHLTNRRLSQVTHVPMSTFARINP
jgi:hypothetical protein